MTGLRIQTNAADVQRRAIVTEMNVVKEEKRIRDRARGSSTPSGREERKERAGTGWREPHRKTRRVAGPGNRAEKACPGRGDGACAMVTRRPEGRGPRPGQWIGQ